MLIMPWYLMIIQLTCDLDSGS